jgi:L-alanine-DL-glutamate epimerase-like enolase superfamily enzyme
VRAEAEVTRRHLLAAAVAAPASARLQGASPASVEPEVVRIKLRHTWTTVMSSSEYRDVLYLKYTRDGITAHGEGAPIVRYHESAETGRKAVDSVRELLVSAEPGQYRKILRQVSERIKGEYAAKSAIDIALMDWTGQKLGVPLYRLFGLDARDAPVTTFSIGIDKPEMIKQKVREAEPFPVLKIKVGLGNDEEILEAVRSVTKKPLRLDANEGFKSKEEAVRKINWLEKMGAEFIEQPLPAPMLEETNWVRSRVHIPILGDEALLRPDDLRTAAKYFDGVVVKLDKTGGMNEALRMILTAKSLGLKVMLGCMVSSSVTITAAAHLSPLVDWADLDGNLLIANDPFEGVLVREGKLILPDRPGLGLKPRPA